MNVLPILEMSMSNELFIFFYENILDDNIFIIFSCLLDICQNSRREKGLE